MSETEPPPARHPPSDWKRDSIWHFRNFVAAVAAIVVTVALGLMIYNWQKPVKSLTCDLIAVGPLVSIEDDVSKRVQIVFDHVPVSNVKFAVVKIANPGNVPIDKADFERPLSLHFGGPGQGRILTAQLLNTHPGNMGATYKVNGDALTLDPLLLNPDDTITLKVIYTSEAQNMTLDARIVGVSEVTGTDPAGSEREANNKSGLFALTVTLTGVLWTVMAGRATRKKYERKYAQEFAHDAAIAGVSLRELWESLSRMRHNGLYSPEERAEIERIYRDNCPQ